MAKPCRITFLAFMFGDVPKGAAYGYTDWDLEVGINWGEGMLEQGFTTEPIDHFNIPDYMEWCKRMLRQPEGVL